MRSSPLTRFFDIRQMLPAGTEPVEALPSNRETYGKYIHLAVPSVCEMVLISLINMMDTVMVSGIGTDAVAAVGLVGQPRMIMLSMFFALNVGITTVVARRRGEKRQDAANATVRTAIVICIALSALLMALLIPLATPLMRFAGAEAGRTLEDATEYFIIMGIALPFQALSMALCAAQRGVGNTKLTMEVNITSNLVNILFNYLLINGIGPFPRLGVRGAAIATAIGLFVGFILSLTAMLRGSAGGFLHISRRDSWKPDGEACKALFKVASSAMVEQLAMRVGFFSYAKIVASLGTDAFAAHQICMQFMNLSFSCADGLGVAGNLPGGPHAGSQAPGHGPHLRHPGPARFADDLAGPRRLLHPAAGAAGEHVHQPRRLPGCARHGRNHHGGIGPGAAPADAFRGGRGRPARGRRRALHRPGDADHRHADPPHSGPHRRLCGRHPHGPQRYRPHCRLVRHPVRYVRAHGIDAAPVQERGMAQDQSVINERRRSFPHPISCFYDPHQNI